ncbi:acyltransferase family protein [Paraburkholderia acidisoli]|uniref:Acyltransferase family protein n=1 Tax=Paraburkholderia acidisoli TaxID=2571748 RepID=A0A7Z2GF51_9BURK|nr:acyltransferase [Paraburkholderia acidisoli]QGZ60671.1 acyltransferase family protein [Paraburkholderia acidisoli]
MGTYRLLLAVAVMLSHIGVNYHGHNPGVIAVASFFLLSGYVMTALIERHYASLDQLLPFYLDRVMRLFPQFLFYSAISLVLIFRFHPQSWFLAEITPWTAALNMTMVPLNFFHFFPHAQTIPQAWSLGLEAQFYLAIPFIIVFRARVLALVLSLLFFVLPYFHLVTPDTWGYRMLPGTLFVFLMGSLLRTRDHPWLLRATYGAVALAAVASLARPADSVFDVLIGVVIGFPVVTALTKTKFGRIDELAGNLSYGMFLNHFALIWAFQVMGFRESPAHPATYLAALLGTSFALSWVSYELVEKRVIRLRHLLRRRAARDEPVVNGVTVGSQQAAA